MISEGTDIPRLQVCCHLTNIKTEMHFRQITGRILPVTDAPNQDAFLYMPAEPNLVEYAYRLAQEVPSEANVVNFEKMGANFKAKSKYVSETLREVKNKTETETETETETAEYLRNRSISISFCKENEKNNECNLLATTYDKMINIFGRFEQEILEPDIGVL